LNSITSLPRPLGHGDEDLLGLVALLVFERVELLEALDARRVLRALALHVLLDPLELALDRLLARGLARFLALQALALLVEPVGVVALVRNPGAAVELEDPLGGVVEEVAIVGDRDDGAGEALEEPFEPLDALRVQVVGGLVEKKHVGLGEEQPAKRHAALLAAREHVHLRIPRRQAQRVGRDLELRLERARVGGGEQLLEPLLLGGELVEVGIGLGVGRVHGVEALLRGEDFAQSLLDRLAHGVSRLELRLLRQVADADARHRVRLAFEILVDARHDAKQRGLARAVEPQQADLGAGVERERNVLEDLAFGRNDLAHADHRIDVLSHRGSSAASSGSRIAGGRKDTLIGRPVSEAKKNGRRDISPAQAGCGGYQKRRSALSRGASPVGCCIATRTSAASAMKRGSASLHGACTVTAGRSMNSPSSVQPTAGTEAAARAVMANPAEMSCWGFMRTTIAPRPRELCQPCPLYAVG
jgi:hypothetical protein